MKKLFFFSILLMLAVWWGVSVFSGADRERVQKEKDVTQEKTPDMAVSSETREIPQETREIEENIFSVPKSIEKVPVNSLIENVPFVVQAPFAEWDNPIFQNACEEASIIMAAHWLSGKPLTKEIATKEIIALAKFQKQWLGHSVDTSAQDTLKLFQEYYATTAGAVHTDIEIADMREALASGSLVIVPADGRKLHNPHFTQPGPPRHMLVIIGYDAKTEEFIANDPGTKHGERYRYPENTLYDAILDYPTGDHIPVQSARKVMVTLGRL